MINSKESEYLLDIIVQHNASLMKKLDSADISDQQKKAIKDRLALSESIFQKIVTLVSSDTNTVSTSNRVLVVDDIASMRSILQAMIKVIGFEHVDTAKDGSEAWTILQRNKDLYGLIVSDWEMPVMGGLELLRKVRKDDVLKKLPFIIVSATNRIDKVQEAIKEGVTDYLTKPITEKTLRKKMGSYIK